MIETGLGGRLDSTNVITPKVAGITSISIDHMQQLGDTLDSIARRRRASSSPAFRRSACSRIPCDGRLKAQALASSAPALHRQRHRLQLPVRDVARAGPHTRVCLTTPTSRFEHLRVPLSAGTRPSTAAWPWPCWTSSNGRLQIDVEKAATGLAKVPARPDGDDLPDPRILVDGAHNAASIRALMKAIGQNIPYDSMVVIFGCGCDKDIPGMLNELQPAPTR